MTRRYTRNMDKPTRLLIAAALLAALVACGNKGPLVKPSQAQAAMPVEVPAEQSPPATGPTDAALPMEIPPPPAADPATATPPEVPPADDSDGGGNG
ncbi:MAG: lipoprotein [Luteimonas sp.]